MRSIRTTSIWSVLLAVGWMTIGCDERSGADDGVDVDTGTVAPTVAPGETQSESASAADGAAGQATAAYAEFGPVVLNQQGPQQVRMGEELNQRVVVTNRSDHPVGNVVIRAEVPQSLEIEKVSLDGQELTTRRTGGRASALQKGQRQQATETDQGSAASATQPAQAGTQGRPGQQDQAQQQQAAANQNRERQAQGQQNGTEELSWRVGRLAGGESRTLMIQGYPQQEGALQYCMTVSYEPEVCAVVRVVKPDLTLEQWFVNRDGQPIDQAFRCEPFAIAYRLTNTGSAVAQDPKIQTELPEGLQTADGKSQLALQMDSLQPGESASETVMLQAKQQGSFKARGVAMTDATKARSAQDSIRILQPELSLQVEGPNQVLTGQQAQYRVTVRNTSDDPAVDTRVLVQEPEGIQFTTLSGQQGVQEQPENGQNQIILGTLDPGKSKSFSVGFQSSDPQQVESRFLAQAYCVAEPETQTVATNIKGIPALRMEAIDLTDPVTVGGVTVYEIQVKNQGTAEDTNIQLTAQLPTHLEFVSGMGDTDVQGQGQQIQFGKIDSLPPNQVASWRVQAKATDAGRGALTLKLNSQVIKTELVEMEPTTAFEQQAVGGR